MSGGSASVRVKSSSGGGGGLLSESGSTRSTRFRFLSWSPETYAIREFLTSFPLPRVVRLTNCDEANLLKTLVLPADVDISQPLLLYKKYRPTKLLAKCLKAQKSGKWKETGPTVVIPDSFPGWFTLLNPDGKECAMTLTSMGQVAAARVPAFLTKFDVPVYKLTDSNEPGNKSVYLRSTTRAGAVLRLLGVWADLGGGPNSCNSYPHPPPQNKSSSNFLTGSLGALGGRLVARSLSLQPNTQPQQQFQYVQCLSLDNEVLFIPFSATGVFYPIAPRGGRNPQHIYPLAAIARIHRLPLRAKMVYGALPQNVPDFTGTLQLERVDTEDVVLACTLMRDKPLLFEIDLDCDLFLSQMTSEDLFIQSTGYQMALSFCRAEADNWRRQVRNYTFGNKAGKGGTVTGAYLLSVKEKNKSLRIRGGKTSASTPSKLSLLFRPSSAPFGSNKDPLRRTKSFNVEIQSVSISLTQDEEEEETKKLSTLFNFMAGKKNKSKNHHPPLQQMSRNGRDARGGGSEEAELSSMMMLRDQEKERQEFLHCKEIQLPKLNHHPLQQQQQQQQESVQKVDGMKMMMMMTKHGNNGHQHQARNFHQLQITQQNHTNSVLHHAYTNNQLSVPDVLSNNNGNNKNPLSHSTPFQHRPVSSRSQRHVLSLHCGGGGGTNSSSGCSSLGNLSYGNCSLSLSPIPTSSSSTNSSAGSSGSGGKASPDVQVPYGTVADEVAEEENIYSEISDSLTMKLSLGSNNNNNPVHQMGLNFHHHHRHHQQNSSNLSSLLKGGSDGTFSGTLSGTFSSSNPSNRDDDIYDAVF